MPDAESKRLPQLSAEQRAALARRSRQRRAAEPIPRRPADARVPLTPAQRALWVLAQLDPDNVAYNQTIAFDVDGAFDLAAFTGALDDLFARHEALRSVVGLDPDDGSPVQHVVPPGAQAVEIEVAECDAAGADAELRARVLRPFRHDRDFPLRAVVLRLGPADHRVVLVAHHIGLDNLAAATVTRELLELYGARVAARPPALDPVALQYGDYAIWIAGRLAGPRGAALEQHWTTALAGVPPVLELPVDHPRPPLQHFDGARAPIALPPATVAAVSAAARAEATTLYMYLLHAFAVLVHRWSGQGDFVVGSPIANRDRLELEALVGYVNNTLALPMHLRGSATWRDSLAATRTTVVDAIAHSELPFERVVQLVNPPRDPSRNPLFQVNFRVTPPLEPPASVAGATWTRIPIDLEYAKFDLALQLHVVGPTIDGFVEYNAALFEPATITNAIDAYLALLDAVTTDPDAPLLSLPAVQNAAPRRVGPGRRRR